MYFQESIERDKLRTLYICKVTNKEVAESTRFFLHADEQFGKVSAKASITIKCLDTYVLVLCCHYYPRMQNTDQL